MYIKTGSSSGSSESPGRKYKRTASLELNQFNNIVMNNPIEALLEWFNLVNEDHQEEIATLILTRLPYMDYKPNDGEAISDFIVWLEEETKPELIVGQVIIARELINYLIEDRGNPLSWNFPMDIFLKVLRDEEEDDHAKTFARDNLMILPKHKNAWLETASSWKKVCRSALSNKALRDWERINLMREAIPTKMKDPETDVTDDDIHALSGLDRPKVDTGASLNGR